MSFTLLRSSAELIDPSVLQDSVKSVFASFNWSNCPVLLEPIASDEPPLTMSVQQFFAKFAWEAESIALPIEPELPARKAFTLDDFSDLF